MMQPYAQNEAHDENIRFHRLSLFWQIARNHVTVIFPDAERIKISCSGNFELMVVQAGMPILSYSP